MVVGGVGAFVGLQGAVQVVVVGGDLGGQFRLLEGIVDNLMSVADPTTGWIVFLTGV